MGLRRAASSCAPMLVRKPPAPARRTAELVAAGDPTAGKLTEPGSGSASPRARTPAVLVREALVRGSWSAPRDRWPRGSRSRRARRRLPEALLERLERERRADLGRRRPCPKMPPISDASAITSVSFHGCGSCTEGGVLGRHQLGGDQRVLGLLDVGVDPGDVVRPRPGRAACPARRTASVRRRSATGGPPRCTARSTTASRPSGGWRPSRPTNELSCARTLWRSTSIRNSRSSARRVPGAEHHLGPRLAVDVGDVVLVADDRQPGLGVLDRCARSRPCTPNVASLK